MRRFAVALAVFAGFFISLSAAKADVLAKVDISSQRMHVYVNGSLRHSWPVSTARRGYYTPRGSYRPISLHRMWRSHKYHMSRMPYSVFFRGGYAIHGTGATRHLGRPASHGCIRLRRSNARVLYKLIKKYGRRNTRIRISG